MQTERFLPASATDDFRSPMYIYSKTDCGIAVRMQEDVGAIRRQMKRVSPRLQSGLCEDDSALLREE